MTLERVGDGVDAVILVRYPVAEAVLLQSRAGQREQRHPSAAGQVRVVEVVPLEDAVDDAERGGVAHVDAEE
jgi:hypothetical protein